MKKFLIFALCLIFLALPLTVFAADAAQTAAPAEAEALTALLSKRFEEWVLPHLEEISVIVTLIFTLFYQIRKNRLLTKSMGLMNNNAVTIAEQSSSMMSRALTGMESASLAVKGYDERIESLLEAYSSTAQDKEKLEKKLEELQFYLEVATKANVEFSNELAELLLLANIPNCKKEEIGKRHLAASCAIIAAAERGLQTNEEAAEHDGEKA